MNISFMNLLSTESVITFDYAWCSFRAYYEENYPAEKDWHWNFPIQSSFAISPQEIADEIIAQKPTVFGASLYVWNVGISLEVIRLVKEALPECYTIVGGPHQEYENDDYFKKYPFIDFCSQTDGYGEVCFTEFLHQVANDKSWNEVPFLIQNVNGESVPSNKSYTKKSFSWPKYFSYGINHYTDKLRNVKSKKKKYFPYETSRGCPYGCVYCEWGGGTNSKVIFKPFDHIIEDFNYLFRELKVEIFSFTDANFGIIKRDVDIIRELCKIKEETGYPQELYFFGPSKTNKQNVYEIERLIAKHGMTVEYKIPIQDINEIVTKNIDRIDDKWQEQFDEYKKIRDEVGGRIRVEMIRGLPGATLGSYYKALDVLCHERVFSDRYSWHLLPTSPAAKQSYIDKFKLKSIETKYGNCFSKGGEDNVVDEKFVLDKSSPRALVFDTDYIEPTKIVVETYSYTKREYAEMYMMDWFILIGEVNGYFMPVTSYLNKIRGIAFSDFYKRFFDKFICGDYLTGNQKAIVDNIVKQAYEKTLSDEVVIDFEYYSLPSYFPWRVKMKLCSMFVLLVQLNRNTFYDDFKSFVFDEFGEDEFVEDLIDWTRESILWIDYDPENPKQYESKMDWHKWVNSGSNEDLVPGRYINTPRQTIYSSEFLPIDWQKYDMPERVQKYFLPMCSNINTLSLFSEIEVTND